MINNLKDTLKEILTITKLEKSEKIWIQFEDKLRSFILGKINESDVAEDILQEVFIRMHTHIDTLKDETKIQSWIYQITRNLIIDHKRKPSGYSSKHEPTDPGDEEDQPDGFMEEALRDMINMMDRLPPGYCEALCLTELEGISQVEYARRIGISYSGAKSRVQRSREMLKEMLMNCCHYEFDRYGTVLDISPKTCCCCNPEKR